MRYRVEFFIEPVKEDEVQGVVDIVKGYGFKINEVVTSKKHKEICIAGTIMIEKIAQLHLKHWAMDKEIGKDKFISKWWSKGIFIEHNPVFK